MHVRGQPYHWSEDRSPQWRQLVSKGDDDVRSLDEVDTEALREPATDWASTPRHYDYDARRWVEGELAIGDHVNDGKQPDDDIVRDAERIVVAALGLERHVEYRDGKGRSRGARRVIVKDRSPAAVRAASPFQRKAILDALNRQRRSPEELRATVETNLENKRPGYVASLMRKAKISARQK